MKFYRCFFLIIFFSSFSLFSQEKYRQHTVSKNETISGIAKKYNVNSSEIYELNPDAVNGIKWKKVLLIPTKTETNKNASASVIAGNIPEKLHEVLPKETLYGIAKQHHITIEDLYKVNPNLEKEGLKIGQTINIPQSTLSSVAVAKETEKTTEVKKPNVSKKSIPNEEIVVAPKVNQKSEIPAEGIEHEVLPKESLYSIAKKYGIKIADLQKANPELANTSIKAGQKISVPVKADANLSLLAEKKTTPVLKQPVVENKKSETEKTIPVVSQTIDDNKKALTTITHEVLPKESLYSIAKKYGVTVAEIQQANLELGTNSLKAGQKITIPIKENTNSNSIEGKVVEKIKEKEIIEITKVVEQPKLAQEGMTGTEVTHEVLPKETKYGIAKQYGISVAELEKQNPSISNKLLVGSVLKIRSSKVIEKEIPVEATNKGETAFVKEKIENTEKNVLHDVAFVEQLISKASENLGTHYRSGGTTTEGFDCSGLMCYTFANTDIKLPRSSVEMSNYGSIIETENAQKGDLIFFKTGGSGRINHVGMVVEVLDGEIKFIHSATRGGVMISSTKESYYQKNLAQVNRVL